MSEEGTEGVPLNQTGNVATTAAAPSSNAEISTASSSVVGEGESSTTTGLVTSNQKMFASLVICVLVGQHNSPIYNECQTQSE